MAEARSRMSVTKESETAEFPKPPPINKFTTWSSRGAVAAVPPLSFQSSSSSASAPGSLSPPNYRVPSSSTDALRNGKDSSLRVADSRGKAATGFAALSVPPFSAAPSSTPPVLSAGLRLKQELLRQAKCPNCRDFGVIVTDYTSGDQLCSECGIVLQSRILSEEQEWRSFSNESNAGKQSDRNRVGGPTDHWMEEGGGTSILGASKKLQQTHDMVCALGSSDKILKAAFLNLRLISEAFSFSENVTERSKEIAKELQQLGHLKGKTSLLWMLAVTYIACREARVSRQVKELVVYDKTLTEKDLGKAILKVRRLLPDRAPTISETAAELMPRFCNRLQLSMHVVDVAEHVSRMASKLINRSRRPCSVAAAALYLVTQLLNVDTDLASIANIAATSEGTIRAVYKEMLPLAAHLLPSEFKPTNDGGLEALRDGGQKRQKRR